MIGSNLFRRMVVGLVGMGMVITLAGCAPAQDEDAATETPPPITEAVEEDIQPTPEPDTDNASEASEAEVEDSPSATATPEPDFPPADALLIDGEPWWVFLASDEANDGRKLWAMNTDGTGLTKLIDERVYAYKTLPQESLSNGLTIAYVTGTQTTCGRVLKIQNVPGGAVQASIPLLLPDLEAECPDTADAHAISEAISTAPSWSPDGSKLAFVGAIDAPNADVYAYDLASGDITRLSDGPDHAHVLSWSPDGRYVIHQAEPTYDFEELLFNPVAGVWAARPDGSGSVPLYDDLPLFDEHLERPYLSTYEFVYGWPAYNEVLLVSTVGYDSNNNNVRLANPDTGAITYIRRCCFETFAFDEESLTWLFLVQEDEDASPYLVFWKDGTEIRIDPEVEITDVRSPGQDVFLGYTHDGAVYRITPEGEFESIPTPDEVGLYPWVYLSPDGEWTIFTPSIWAPDQPGMWMAKTGDEPVLVIDEFVESIYWSPDGPQFYFVSRREEGDIQRLYRLDLSSLEPEFMFGEFYDSSRLEWVP